jgi:hypothetical protein
MVLDCALGWFSEPQRLAITTAAAGAMVALFTMAAAGASLASAFCVKQVREMMKWSE